MRLQHQGRLLRAFGTCGMSALPEAIARLERATWDNRVIARTADIRALLDAYKALVRPAEPKVGDRDVTYRGWECGYNIDASLWGFDGWEAYLGGPDIDAPRVTARTWADLLDEIDEHDLTEAVA